MLAAASLAAWCGCAAAATVLPPCSGQALPAYAEVGLSPNVAVWKPEEAEDLAELACIGWTKGKNPLIVGIAGAFHDAGSVDALIGRFGAISKMAGIRYWSVTDKDWKTLITEASAIQEEKPQRRRADFTVEELRSGLGWSFEERDNRSSANIAYRIRLRQASANGLVMEMENASPVKAFGIVTVFAPGELRHLFFADRRGQGDWNFYELVSASGRFARGNEASIANRAMALFLHFAGLPATAGRPVAAD